MESARCRAFLTAAEAGSFSRAAEKLHYTPSGVSQLVTAFEESLGFPLLIRSKKGVALTDNGKELLPAVRDFLQQESRIHQIAAEINGLTIGTVNIASYSSIAAQWLAGVIKDFQQDYPGITINLMEGVRKEVSLWLGDKRADIAFFSYKEDMPYDWIPLRNDPMVAVLPREHPLAGKTAYPLAECEKEDFIMPGGADWDEDAEELLCKNDLTVKIKFSTLENFSAMSMIEQGLGMSIMNDLITRNWRCDVVKLPLEPPQHITLGIAVPSLKNSSPAVRRFVVYAQRRLKEL